VLSQHSPLASLHIDTNQSAGKPTYLPMNPPLQSIEKFFFPAESVTVRVDPSAIEISRVIQLILQHHFAKLLCWTLNNLIS